MSIAVRIARRIQPTSQTNTLGKRSKFGSPQDLGATQVEVPQVDAGYRPLNQPERKNWCEYPGWNASTCLESNYSSIPILIIWLEQISRWIYVEILVIFPWKWHDSTQKDRLHLARLQILLKTSTSRLGRIEMQNTHLPTTTRSKAGSGTAWAMENASLKMGSWLFLPKQPRDFIDAQIEVGRAEQAENIMRESWMAVDLVLSVLCSFRTRKKRLIDVPSSVSTRRLKGKCGAGQSKGKKEAGAIIEIYLVIPQFNRAF